MTGNGGRPEWLNLPFLLQIATLLVTVTISFQVVRSDQRSDHEEIQRISRDIQAIRQSLPDTSAYDLKFHVLEVDGAKIEERVRILELQETKLEKDLIKGGCLK